MADLWHSEPGLPCYPLIDRLGEMEFDRAFWKGHRDHIVHHLLTYLLGLYFYFGSDLLREALAAELSEEEFLRAWKIAALFHDLGYVFEVEYERRSEVYYQVFDELNDLNERCLHHYFAARNVSVLRAEDTAIRNRGEIFMPRVRPDHIRGLGELGDRDLFLPLEPIAQRAHLGEIEDSLRWYWEYAMTRPTLDRTRRGYSPQGGLLGRLRRPPSSA